MRKKGETEREKGAWGWRFRTDGQRYRKRHDLRNTLDRKIEEAVAKTGRKARKLSELWILPSDGMESELCHFCMWHCMKRANASTRFLTRRKLKQSVHRHTKRFYDVTMILKTVHERKRGVNQVKWKPGVKTLTQHYLPLRSTSQEDECTHQIVRMKSIIS